MAVSSGQRRRPADRGCAGRASRQQTLPHGNSLMKRPTTGLSYLAQKDWTDLGGIEMKLLTTTILSLSLVTSASAQTISIARSGSQPPRPGPAPNSPGSLRVDPLFQASDPARASGG